jgi:uncharacterized protein (TIGR02246 family)
MQDDIRAIEELIADIETGFNAKDPQLSTVHFTDDASAVSVAGVLVAGRAALLDAHRTAFAGPLREQYARYELADVTFLRPDVAVAHKHARAVTAEGEPLDVGHTMIALYVLVRDGGRWRVAARQNTMAVASEDT